MPRSARQESESKTYHVMLRGINRQQIFYDDEDYNRFLQTLERVKHVSGYELLGYCLMPNHVHLLIREGKEPLRTIFRRIGASYVYWYNTKYDRTGHLFQDRFRSESVEDDAYLLTALRYIHRNPVKAGLCKGMSDYRYSSYSDYIDNWGITDTDLIMNMLGKEEFIEYHKRDEDVPCMDVPEEHKPRLSDRKAIELMKRSIGCDNPVAFQQLDSEEQKAGIRILMKHGASIRQASRLTGISFNRVRGIAQQPKSGGRFSV